MANGHKSEEQMKQELQTPAPIKATPDPTFDGPGSGVGMKADDVEKARKGRTIKMGPGGVPYVE